ncbi:MAG TPA: hypothetical protein VGQ75_02470 [Thermoanaerobaculia bacterium]|nr:hypothetical protein [Thermoanaerobaculia bacterium]
MANGDFPIRAALGFRPHSGWAALVAVAGTPRAPQILDRRRIDIADREIDGSLQPYHAAEERQLADARKYLERCERHSRRLAREALRDAIHDLQGNGVDAISCGLLLASGRPLPALTEILASHALIHAADGEHFREAIRAAASELGLPVVAVKEKEIWARASGEMRIPTAELQQLVSSMRKAFGPPWTQDQKLAALSAWLAIACESYP